MSDLPGFQIQRDAENALTFCYEQHKNLRLGLQRLETFSQQANLHLLAVEHPLNSIRPSFDDLSTRSNAFLYLGILKYLEQLSDELAKFTDSTAVKADTFLVFSDAIQVYDAIASSRCERLVEFVSETVGFWYDMICKKLVNCSDQVFNSLGWPPESVSMEKPKNDGFSQKEVDDFVYACLTVDPPATDVIYRFSTSPYFNTAIFSELIRYESRWFEISTLARILLIPYAKRFNYLFSTPKSRKHVKTHEKPEFYFTQALMWIRESLEHLDTSIQPIIDDYFEPLTDTLPPSISDQFVRGIVLLVQRKVLDDLTLVLSGPESLFCHFVDIALTFESEMIETFQMPFAVGNIMALNDDFLSNWLTVEQGQALIKLDDILNQPNAWECLSGNEFDTERVPQCLDQYTALLQSIVDRFSLLSKFPKAQIKFTEVILGRLEDLLKRFEQLARDQRLHLPLLNGAHCLEELVEGWNDEPLFIKLFCLSQKPNITLNNTNLDSILNSLEFGYFDEFLHNIKQFKADLLKTLLSVAHEDLKQSLRVYAAEKWFILQAKGEDSISRGALGVITVLMQHLEGWKQGLCLEVFQNLSKDCARSIDRVIFDRIIAPNTFSPVGIAQLKTDIQFIKMVFKEYVFCFERILDSLRVLELGIGSALLLHERFSEIYRKKKEEFPQELEGMEASVKEIGIFNLTVHQVACLIKSRVDVQQFGDS